MVTFLSRTEKIGEAQVSHGKLRIGLEKDSEGWILIVRRGDEECRKRIKELSFEELYATVRMTARILPPLHLVADTIFRLLNMAKEYQRRSK